MIKKIKKRDGSVVPFDKEKIVNAIFKAAQSIGGKNKEESEKVANLAIEYLNEKFKLEDIPTVEEVQDCVEKALIERGHAATAKAYILYRFRKKMERETKELIGVKDDLKLSVNSIKVLERRYLLKDENGKVIETPSQLFRRVAKHLASAEIQFGGIGKDVEYYENSFYNMMTNFEFIPNSPTLMNSGTSLGQLSACFVLGIKDDIVSIFDSVKHAAIIHKSGGGTGYCFSFLRPRGDFVKSTAGVASGPLSFMTVFDHATNVIKQGGRRRGANMGVLHIWHPNVEEFITAKQTPGFLENFNVSVAIDDQFMKAFDNDEEYNLKNPRSQDPHRKVKAKTLFNQIAYSAWKSAEPGVLFIDTINNTNPTPKYPIHSTNPCVTGDTLISTNEGLVSADNVHNPHHVFGLDGGYHPVKWAGETGIKEVYKLETKAGYEVCATADHLIYVNNAKWKPLGKLTKKDRVILQGGGRFGNKKIDKNMALMFGWLVGDGHISKNNQDVIFYFNKNEKSKLLPKFKKYLDKINGREVRPQEGETEIRLKYSSKIAKMFTKFGLKHAKSNEKEIPRSLFEMNKTCVKNFLSALFGSDGSVQGTKEKGISIRLSSNSLKLLKQVQILLLLFGIFSTIYKNRRKAHKKKLPDSNRNLKEYNCKAQHELIISRESMNKYMDEIGFCISEKEEKFKKLKPKKIYADNINSHISSIEKIGKMKVYDLTEPATHAFSANGIMVHNCGEVPMPDYESCNLGSINMEKFVKLDWSEKNWKDKVNWDKLREVVRSATVFLDNVVQLNKYPIEEIKERSLHHRRIGLGVMGFANLLIKLGVRYGSDQSIEIAKEIMKFITTESRKMSNELGRVRGSFPGFKDSTLSKQFDAMRNATVTSIAPTGTISMIADTSSGIEPLFALAFVKNVMDGTKLYYSNELFEQVLKEKGLYSEELMQEVIQHGTIQELEILPKEIREVFVISYDIKAEEHVKMQAAFQKYTDLAVSKTINMPHDATVEDVEHAYLLAWRLGCKGITVYRDGSRGAQVLNIIKKPSETKTMESANK